MLTISEAAIRLHHLDPTLLTTLAPDFDWSGARGIGNVLRHRYDAIDTSVIAEVLTARLPQLRVVCEAALSSK